MQVGDEYEATPISVSRLGEAIAIVEAKSVFIPNAKVGVKVRIRIVKVMPSYAYGVVVG